MQIVIEKSTSRAVLMFSDEDQVVLSADCLEAPGLMACDIATSTHEVVSGEKPAPPLHWVPGALAFDGTWSVHDQAAYDALVTAAKVRHDNEVAAQAAAAVAEVRKQRAAAYPPTTDYIDGIVKGDAAQVQAYIDACLAVKAKYPKPV